MQDMMRLGNIDSVLEQVNFFSFLVKLGNYSLETTFQPGNPRNAQHAVVPDIHATNYPIGGSTPRPQAPAMGSFFCTTSTEMASREGPNLQRTQQDRVVVLDTPSEGPDRLFVPIVTVFVQIVTNILNGSDV